MNGIQRLWVLLLLLAGGHARAAEITGTTHKFADDPLLTQAREAVIQLAKALPDFVCRETVSRFRASPAFADWLALDVLAADVIFKNGKESYQNLSVNGKPAHRRMDQLKGAWSIGEFGSVLLQLFSPATAAEFHPVPDDSPGTSSDTRTYAFEVSRAGSQWMISVGGRATMPPYKGTVRVNVQTGGVARLEMQAEDLPSTFPAYRVESAIDYQPVPVGGKAFLLPTLSEMVMCFRSESSCVRNTIAFTDYHKFGSESRVQFLGR